MAGQIRCSSCGEGAQWLVTLPYGDGSQAGRILAYCRRCRSRHPGVLVSIPLELVDRDAFLKLYELGYTESATDTATEVIFGEERAEISESAEGLMRRRLPERLTERLLDSKGELPAILTVTNQGLYALWLDDEAYHLLDLVPGLDGVAYVGVGAGQGGIARRFEEEWRPLNSGRSTPRRTLGSLLLDELGLQPMPRPTRTAAPNPTYFRFADDGEWGLTDWIETHAAFAYVEVSSQDLGDWETLAKLEKAVIQYVRPPLNINGWQNPARPRLKALRETAARMAEQTEQGR